VNTFAPAPAHPARHRYVAVLALLAGIPVLAVALGGSTVRRMRHNSARRERRFRSLLESAPDAIVIVDRSGRVVLANDRTTEMFGYSTGELLGQPVELLIPDEVRADHERHRADYYAAPSTRPMGALMNLLARRKDGSVFPAEISLSPLDAEEGLLVTSVIRDVSERRRLEDEHQRLRADAEAERERQRIAMDLHDGVIQSIYAVGLNLEAAAGDIATHPGEVATSIDRAIDELNDVIADIRAYIAQLRPARFSGEVAESLAGIAHEFRVDSLIDTTIDVAQTLPPLPAEAGSALFHITREALNNVRKHARASSVEIRLRVIDDLVRLDIVDDGAGFDPSAPRAERHNGLRNMASRARAAGGTLRVESAPRTGTRIRVEIPASRAPGEPG
jgi:two-component system sensor histidine kinase DevS